MTKMRCCLKLDTRRALKDGTYPVKVYIAYGRDLWIPTGYSVNPDYWNDVTGKLEAGPDMKLMNDALSTCLVRVSARVLSLREQGRLDSLTNSELRQLLTAPDMDTVVLKDRRVSVQEAFRRFIATKDNESTKALYGHTLKHLDTFCSGKPLHFEDIDRIWLSGFEAHIGGKVNARAVHLRNLRAVCNFALDEEYTTVYPFRRYKIRQEETRKKALTLEQVRSYLEAPDLSRWDQEHRDMFILMLCLRGINAGDLADLTPSDLKDGRICYRRNKTGHLYSVKVEPEALEIIERWRGERHLLTCFDRYDNYRDYAHHLNDALKRMTGPDGRTIEPDCTSNWARHTWATFAAELDIPDPTISLGMGHVSAGHRTTAIYIKRDEAKVDAANRAVLDYIFGGA